MRLYVDDASIRVGLADGGEVEVRGYDGTIIDGLEDDLGDGEMFTCADGCTVTRHGDEAIWVTPKRPR